MPTDLERLVVSLEASITKYEKAMNRAVGISNQRAKQVEDRWNKLSFGKQLGRDAFKGFTAGAASALLPTLTFVAAIDKTKEALQEFGDIADQSKSSGLDPEFFQGIAYQAKLGGIEIGGMADAMSTFFKLSGQAVEGRGKLVAQLKDEHAELLKGIQAATTQEQRFRLVVDAIHDAKSESEAATIAAAAFGDQGTKIAAAFNGGSAQIDETMRKARDLGLIIDRDIIDRADELGDQFDTVALVLDRKIKKELIDLGPVLLDLINLAGQFVDALGSAKQLAQHPGDLLDVIANGSHAAGELARFRQKMLLDIQAAQQSALNPGGDTFQEFAGAGLNKINEVGAGPSQRDLEEWFKVHLAPAAALPSLPGMAGGATPAEYSIPPLKGLLNGALGAGGSGGTKPIKDQVDATTGSLKQMGDAVDYDSTAWDELKQQVETATQLGQDFANTFIEDLLSGKDAVTSLADAFEGLGKQLLQMGTNAAIQALFSNLFGIALGGGPTGGTFGNGLWGSAIFGGARAAGGPVDAGKAYLVGENGPEPFIPKVPGTILPSKSLGRAGRGDVTMSFVINGGDRQAFEQFKSWARLELPGTVRRIVNDPYAVG